MIIACDLDGVLCEINHVIVKRVNKDFKLELDGKHIDRFDLIEVFKKNGVSYNYIVKMFQDEWLWADGLPIQENIEQLKIWAGDSHEIHIVSGRNNFAAIPTQAWLKKHEVPFTKIHQCRLMKKYEYLVTLKDPIFIEDRFFEAYKAASYGIPSFVVRKTYNEDYESRVINKLCRFVDSLKEIEIG